MPENRGPTQILSTKLQAPGAGRDLIPRPRIVERLNGILDHRLTLLSAPAGFGKTTALAQWIASLQRQRVAAGWLSLDKDDSDPARFLRYLIGAFQSARPGVGETALQLMEGPQRPTHQTILTPLINEIAASDGETAVVLDDYHAIDSDAVHDAVRFLIDHLPANGHLVIASRETPPLPLPLLRGRGALLEIGVEHLRFTRDEIAAFLRATSPTAVSAEDAASLETTSEGWVAGLQLFALSLSGDVDLSERIRSLTGSHRFIFDYLVDEVLRRQPEPLRDFLHRTSVLSRLSGPLCDVLTGATDGTETLEQLHRANLFIYSLDAEGRWYRYHHLFADVLRQRLHQDDPALLSDLHRLASRWHEDHGSLAEAVGHALEGRAFDRAADLIEATAADSFLRGETSTPLRWFEALPSELIEARPRLAIWNAWALTITFKFDEAEERLGLAESTWRSEEDKPANGAEVRELQGAVATCRAGIAAFNRELEATVKFAREALDLLPHDAQMLRSNCALAMGTAYWGLGDLVAASESFDTASRFSEAAGNNMVTLMALCNLAGVLKEQGKPRDALATSKRALRIATAARERPLPTASMAFTGVADVLREFNQLADAAGHARRGVEHALEWGNIEVSIAAYATLSDVHAARNEFGDAEIALDRASQLAEANIVDFWRSRLAAKRARFALARGDLEPAVQWARECGLKSGDAADYVSERELTVLARVLLAQGDARSALDLTSRMIRSAETGDRQGAVIELSLLQAIAVSALRGEEAALAPLERALSLAHTHGYVRLVLDEGRAIDVLLEAARAKGIEPDYVGVIRRAQSVPASPETVGAQVLADPVSRREAEVLRLIAAGRSNQEIADELVVALSTVKTHINNLYGKLGVTSRTQAVARARELHLV